MVKAQAGYIRTVNELREKVAELEGNKLIKFIRSKLSSMLELIAGLVGGAFNGTDKRTLALIATLAYIAWPRVAPAIRSAIKRSLATLADKLFIQSKIGHIFQRIRMRLAAILVSAVTLIMPSRSTVTGTGEGQSGAAPVASLVTMLPPAQAPVWSPTLETIAELPHSVAPVVGRIGQANAMLIALAVPDTM
jgi:hypothetical protein